MQFTTGLQPGGQPSNCPSSRNFEKASLCSSLKMSVGCGTGSRCTYIGVTKPFL